MTSVQITPGDIFTRAELKEIFGGSLQGGIIPSQTTDNILTFTDHESAKRYGYQDGWLAEEDETGPVFEYTGEGSRGNQTLKRNNGSLLRHAEDGRAVHLFVAVGTVEGSATKLHRYVGEFTVDESEPFIERQALDSEKDTRWVYVFRLRPVAEVEQAPEDFVPPADETVIKQVPATPMADSAYALRTPAEATASKVAKPEKNSRKKTTRKATGPVEVKRIEAELSDRFLAFLQEQGHEVTRFDIRIKGLASILFTDLYDATDNVLYEIKSKSDRGSVRAAIAQLIDYRRHIPPKDAQLAVLLPERPHEDLRDLVDSAGMALVYENGDKFTGWPIA
jgi:5-methylcytosine-specific restriction protein A